MTAADLLAKVERHGGRLIPNGDRLRVTAPGPLPGELVVQIRARRDELLRLADYERRVRAWLAEIGETDPETIEQTVANALTDPDGLSKYVTPPDGTPWALQETLHAPRCS